MLCQKAVALCSMSRLTGPDSEYIITLKNHGNPSLVINDCAQNRCSTEFISEILSSTATSRNQFLTKHQNRNNFLVPGSPVPLLFRGSVRQLKKNKTNTVTCAGYHKSPHQSDQRSWRIRWTEINTHFLKKDAHIYYSSTKLQQKAITWLVFCC